MGSKYEVKYYIFSGKRLVWNRCGKKRYDEVTSQEDKKIVAITAPISNIEATEGEGNKNTIIVDKAMYNVIYGFMGGAIHGKSARELTDKMFNYIFQIDPEQFKP